jgi:hypoxanthine phosphoribosyltransferase
MAMLKHTPYFILDRLRIVEHFVLSSTFGRESEKSDLTPAIWDDGLPISNDKSQNLNILIVDDAIDTGKTMLCVLQEVKHRCPDATVKTAVITITTKKPLVIPNYCLFHLQLFRFPWSADVK